MTTQSKGGKWASGVVLKDPAQVEKLLAATRRRRRNDTNNLQISSTEARKEEEDLVSEPEMVRSCEEATRAKSSDNEINKNPMNCSFGTKIVVEDFTPVKIEAT